MNEPVIAIKPWSTTEFHTRKHMRYKCRCQKKDCSTYRFTLSAKQLARNDRCRSCKGPISIDWYRMYKGSSENYTLCRCATYGDHLAEMSSRDSPHRKGSEGCLYYVNTTD